MTDLEPPPGIAAEIDFEDRVQPAIFAFNSSPSDGIGQLCDALGAPRDPSSISRLLRTVSGLVGRRVGEFLSRPENSEILRAYFRDLRIELPFLDALHHCLTSGLVLPAEGEHIDRILQTWAFCWASRHPSSRIDAGQAHILAFATVMLNSDLHHPDIRDDRRMTVDQFVSLVQSAIPESAFPKAELVSIYQKVKSRPLRLNIDEREECLALTAPKMKGNLLKRGQGLFAPWTQHYFVLTHSFLYYFETAHATSDSPAGVIEVRYVNLRSLDEDQIVITAQRAEIPYVKFVRRKPTPMRGVREIVLRAPNMQTRDKWLYRLRTSGVCPAIEEPNWFASAGMENLGSLVIQREEENAVLRSQSHADLQFEPEPKESTRATGARRFSVISKRPSMDESD
jgi:hypothetical protein